MSEKEQTSFGGSILGSFRTTGPPRVVMGIVCIAGLVAIAIRDPAVADKSIDILAGIAVVAILWPMTKRAQVRHTAKTQHPARAVGGK